MGKYGYESWGSGWGSGWNKSKGGSVSGWEKSHFGGFRRVISDYPYISMDFDLDVSVNDKIGQDLGPWMGEKLIKLYVLKASELGLIDKFETQIVEKIKFLGVKKYMVAKLDSEYVFEKICNNYTEMSPLFRNYQDGIFGSSISMEIPESGDGKGKGEEGKGENEEEENKSKGSGENKEGEDNEDQENSKDGEGEGEGEDNENQENPKDGEGEGEGEGEGKDKDSKNSNPGDGSGGSGQSETGRSGNTIQELMKKIKESKPYNPSRDLSSFDITPKFLSFSDRIKRDATNPFRFTSSEIKDAEALIKLLDINFDPKSAEVKNLKMGKLDCSKISEVPAGNVSVYKQIVEDQDTKPFSVCVLADMSGSMGRGARIPSQLHIMNSLYLAMSQILPADKLYIYGHSGDSTPEIYSFYTPYDTDYERNIKYYTGVPYYQNYDGPVIEAIHKKIRETNDDRIIFISLSDGEPCGHNYGGTGHLQELKRILEKARRDSFVTVGIGIEADHVSDLYTYAKPVWNLTTMPRDVASIINQVVRTEFK